MSPLSHALTDSATMLRRDVRHSLRNPMMTISGLVVPVFMMLLFVGVFGGALGASLGGRTDYVTYLAPGIVLMAVGAGAATTAVNVSMDMSEGIIDRFRTMSIGRSAVLNGAVVGAVFRTVITVVLTLAVALLLGFRPTAAPLEWLGALGVVVMLTLAVTWLGVAFGLFTGSPAGANSLAQIPQLLPFLSSAFVPVDSVPAGMRWFVENQPYTPVIETLRGLLTGTPIGGNAVLAVTWCAGITLVGYVWATRLFQRGPGKATGRTAAQIMSS